MKYRQTRHMSGPYTASFLTATIDRVLYSWSTALDGGGPWWNFYDPEAGCLCQQILEGKQYHHGPDWRRCQSLIVSQTGVVDEILVLAVATLLAERKPINRVLVMETIEADMDGREDHYIGKIALDNSVALEARVNALAVLVAK